MIDRLEIDHMQLNEMNPTSVSVEDPAANRHRSVRSESLRIAVPREDKSVTRYKAVPEHLYCDLNGEAVVLSLANGRYYGMNGVGARIWELVQEPRSVEEIERSILLEYEVEPDVCRQQVSDFLRQMEAEDLLVVVNESGPEIP